MIIAQPHCAIQPDPADPDFYSGFVVLGEYIMTKDIMTYEKAIEFEKLYAPKYGGVLPDIENAYEVQQGPNKEYCHDFALILLKEPIRVKWRRTGINS